MKTDSPLPLRFVAALASASLVWAGCANLCEIRDPRTGQNIPATFTGTSGILQRPSPAGRPVTLRSVQTVSCTNFDRVVFEFEGASRPGYHVSYIDKPIRQCGSGEVVPVAGDAWLEVRMTPAQAHTDAGQATIAERNRVLNYANLKQLVQVCDFEGEVTWVLGVGFPGRFRVVELANPPRLVVDVKR